MDKVKNIVEDIGIASLENNIKLAAVAVVSDTGKLVFQTENWDLSNQTNVILDVIKGASWFVLSSVDYSVVQDTAEGFVGSNSAGMGHIIFAPFQGGVLVAYAMPQAEPSVALNFLKNYATRLNGIL